MCRFFFFVPFWFLIRFCRSQIAAKLQLGSAQDAEFVCAKAIRDGVVDAVLDHKLGYMRSKEIVDTYSTTAPRKALHLRTCFCLDIHNEAVKAMRYPPDAFLRKPGTDEDAVKDEKLKDEIKEAILFPFPLLDLPPQTPLSLLAPRCALLANKTLPAVTKLISGSKER